MAELLVLYLHLLAALYAFTKRWQEEGLGAGLLAAAFIGLFFVWVWTLTGALASAVIASPMVTPWLSRDGVGLLLPLPLEAALFAHFFLRKAPEQHASGPAHEDSSR